MSATNRGAERRESDAYMTPAWCVEAILPHLGIERALTGAWSGHVELLDPCCGDGGLLGVAGRYLARFADPDRWSLRGLEVDEERASVATGRVVALVDDSRLDVNPPICVDRRDALLGGSWFPPCVENARRVVLTNPPYNLAREFADRAIREVYGSGNVFGVVAMLLRLNWLAGQKRAEWMRAHTPSVYVLSRRPSFTGMGTDATDYAWMVWSAMTSNRGDIRVLDLPERR